MRRIEPVLVVPLLADRGESVLQDQLTGSNVIGADGCSHCADVALASRALKQLDEPSTRVPLPAVGRLDRVPDLDHAGGIGWTVVTGPADGQHALRVPNHTGDPPCAARVVQNLRTSSAPYSTPLGTSEVAGHRYSGGRVRRSQVAASKGVQRGRTQLHDPNSSHLARRGIPSLIDVGHLPTIPDTARDQKASSRIAGTRSLTDQGSAYGQASLTGNPVSSHSVYDAGDDGGRDLVDGSRVWRPAFPVGEEQMRGPDQRGSERVHVGIGRDAAQVPLGGEVGGDHDRCLTQERDTGGPGLAQPGTQGVARDDQTDDCHRDRLEQVY